MLYKNNILHLIETEGPGGAETVFSDILDYMKGNDRLNRHIAGFTKTGWIYQRIKNNDHEVVLFETKKSFDYTLIMRLVKYIRRHRIHLIHSHLPDISFYSSIAARIAGIPHIMTEHGDIRHFSKNSFKLNIKYLILTITSNCIITVSYYNKKALKDKFPWSKNKIKVIHNGIKLRDCSEKALRSRVRQELSLVENEIAVCNVANLYPVKGHEVLICAMKRVSQKYKFIKLFIVGRGLLDQHLKNIVKRLNLQDKVIFLGFRQDVKKILAGMDLFVLTSYTEGLPISVIEAMDAGLNIIATDVGGISEINKMGGDIRLVRVNTAESVAKSVDSVIDERQFFNQKNKKAVHKFFSLETMSKKYSEIYKHWLKNVQSVPIN